MVAVMTAQDGIAHGKLQPLVQSKSEEQKMRVTRDMVHEDLQPYYNRLRGFEAVIKYRWLSKVANRLLNRAVAGKNRDTLNCNEVYIPSSDGRWQIRARGV